MRIENPKLDESQNPNITHESAAREWWLLVAQAALLIALLFALARGFAWWVGNHLPYAYEQRYLAPIAQGLLDDTSQTKNYRHWPTS